MARPSDREFSLKRKIKDLEEINARLELEVKKLKKQLDRQEPVDDEFTKKKKNANISEAKPCPDCGAKINTTDLPHAVMELCSKGCGFRKVRNK